MLRRATMRQVFAAGNKNIKPRRRGRRHGLLLAFALLLFGSPPGLAALEIDTPDVGLTGVPATISVSGAGAGETVELTAAGRSVEARADENGAAEFTDLVFAEIGVATIGVRAGSGFA